MSKLKKIYAFFHARGGGEILRRLQLIIFISLLTTTFVSLQPVIMAVIINEAGDAEHINNALVFSIAGAYILILATRKLSVTFTFMMLINMRNDIVTLLSGCYLKAIYSSGFLKARNQNTGDLTQKINQASEDTSTLIKNLSSNFVPPLFQLLFTIVAIFISGDILVSIIFCLYLIIYLLIKSRFNSKIVELYSDFYSTSVKRFSLLTDSIKNIDVVRSAGTFDFLFARYRNFLHKIALKHKRLIAHDSRFLLIEAFLSVLFFGSAFFISLYRVINNEITVGHFVMITSYLMLLSSPLEMIGSMFTAIEKSTSSVVNFIDELEGLDEKEPSVINHDVIMKATSTSLSLKNVNFRYEQLSDLALIDVSIYFEAGSFTTITGKSGSGKSTLAKLIAGKLVGYEGDMRFNESDSKIISRHELSNLIYFVTQDDLVFMDTLEFNLQIVNPSATEKMMIEAIGLSNLSEVFDFESENSPLSTLIGDDGSDLSGGQKQRLSLARLFLRQPKVIILDEATSSLDTQNEVAILSNIRRKFPDATMINISHRPSTFKFSDNIAIMEKGAVIEMGQYKELIKESDFLRKINENNKIKEVS